MTGCTRFRRLAVFAAFAAAAGILLAAPTSCTRRLEVGPLQTESRAVDVGEAQSVSTKVVMNAGTLEVSGGSTRLLDAEFSYNIAEWKPEVSYDVHGGRGDLLVRQPKSGGVAYIGSVHNEWNLKLSDTIPMDLTVQFGTGRSTLELGNLSLGGLDIDAGAGEVFVGLTGSPSVSKLDIKIGAGTATVDLSGEWKHNLDATIKGGVGKAIVHLPDDVGVRVTARHGLGKVNPGSLVRKGEDYVNEAFGSAGVTLSIDIETGIGEIDLIEGGPSDEGSDDDTGT